MDTLKTTVAQQTGDPASAFISFLWANYVSSPAFLSMILVVFVLLWIMRTLVFDNKGIKWAESNGWAYPTSFILIVAFVVWLKGGIEFATFKQYLADFITQLSATLFIYLIIGHRLVKWAGNWAAEKMGLNKDIPPVDTPPLGLPDVPKTDVNSGQG